MRLPAIALTSALVASPALAKDVTITMNDQEQKVFLVILDQALKQGGLQNLQAVTQFVSKFQQATAPIPMTPETKSAPEAKK